MLPFKRLLAVLLVFALFVTFFQWNFISSQFILPSPHEDVYRLAVPSNYDKTDKFNWVQRKEHYPIPSYEPIPKPSSGHLLTVQHSFPAKDSKSDAKRKERQDKVKAAMHRCWKSYHDRAWLHDELSPISGGHHDTFGGWAATLVDSLDTLWIMDLHDEFREAVDAAVGIDFTETSQGEINVFETTIRYLGGFIAAYDLSGDPRLLDKSLELAHMLYAAFDTPNRMPITRWDFNHARTNGSQIAPDNVLLAEIGSLTLEFTRLAQITHDARWYDAIHRIMTIFDRQQNASDLPGMWPMVVNARDEDFHSGNLFTLGAMADSMYEYLPKMFALLGGSDLYARLYEHSMSPAIEHNFFRPMTPTNADILMSGPVTVSDRRISTQPEGQHLVCYAGGMLALGGKLMGNDSHVAYGRKLTDGCIWAYESSLLGIMPETYSIVACEKGTACVWDEEKWRDEVMKNARPKATPTDVEATIERQRLSKGFTYIGDKRYALRPEAIESVFYLYRITGDEELQEAAWRMFENIAKYTTTQFGNAAINDVTHFSSPKADSMESFWTAETLKYFYLVFSEPSLISLDEYVLNTEAHPFKRPV